MVTLNVLLIYNFDSNFELQTYSSKSLSTKVTFEKSLSAF